jgi:GNAT superfamily N-acetyltransferase
MSNPGEQTEQQAALPRATSLEAAARLAFAEHVRLYDERDPIIVHAEPHQVRLVYMNLRASRQSSSATFIQCRVDEGSYGMWISSLQVSGTLRRQGLGREMVAGVEATARAIGLSSVTVYPLIDAVGFWTSLGYVRDEHMARVLTKRLY